MYDRVVEAGGGAVRPREMLWVFLRLHSRGVWEHRQNLLRKFVMLVLMSKIYQLFHHNSPTNKDWCPQYRLFRVKRALDFGEVVVTQRKSLTALTANCKVMRKNGKVSPGTKF